MKKILSYLFAMLLVSAFVACGDDKKVDAMEPEVDVPTSTIDSCVTENLAPGENAEVCKANA